jgi:hypothetical protein
MDHSSAQGGIDAVISFRLVQWQAMAASLVQPQRHNATAKV